MNWIARMRSLGVVLLGSLLLASCQKSEEKPPATTAGGKPVERLASNRADRPVQPVAKSAKSDVESKQDSADLPNDDFSSQASQSPAADEQGTDQTTPETELGQVDPASLLIPKVLMTEGHQKTCLVGVGDAMPVIALNDAADKQQTLSKLLGKRLTVVVFWEANNPYALEELSDLESMVSERYGKRGLQVVAINVRDKSEMALKIIAERKLTFPNLLDPDGAELAKVCTRKLPRTYLLDAQGKILWFDIEYSRSTRRDLTQAVQFVLNQG